VKRKRQSRSTRAPWNKGKVIGRKLPLSQKQIRSIRIRLNSARQIRELALFNLAIDSNLNACDIVQLRVRDIAKGRRILSRTTIAQLQSERAIQFEITDETRDSVAAWIAHEKLKPDKYLFPSRLSESPHLSTRQYARLVSSWVRSIGLDPGAYGTESLRRTKAALIYRRTRSLLAAQLFLGHTRLRSTARFLGIEVKR
jgi:site-specific recombinase XerD